MDSTVSESHSNLNDFIILWTRNPSVHRAEGRACLEAPTPSTEPSSPLNTNPALGLGSGVPVPGVFLKFCPKVNQSLQGHGVLELVTQAPSGEWDTAGTGKDTGGFILLLFVFLTCEDSEPHGKGALMEGLSPQLVPLVTKTMVCELLTLQQLGPG